MARKIILLSIILLSFLFLFLLVFQFQSKGFFVAGDEFREIGDILGLTGFLILWWEYVLGIRPVVRIFMNDLSWSNHIHKLMGEYGVVLILFHPFFLLVDGWTHNLPLTIVGFDDTFSFWVTVGTIAFLILFAVWLTSALIREKIAYRPWKLIHLATYPLLFLVYFHSRFSGLFLHDPTLRTYFDLLFVLFVIGAFYRLLFQLGILGKAEYETKSVVPDTDDVIRLTVTPKKKILKSKPGQYLYIQTSPFGEAHPFSVSDYHDDNDDMTFGIKFLGKFSENLKNLKKGDPVLLDGPYGEFVDPAYRHKNNIVLIAGGIGITPFLDLIEDVKLNPDKYKTVSLFYGNKSVDDISFKKEIADASKKNPNFKCFDVLSEEKPKGRKYEYGFITLDELKKHLMFPLTSYDFFLCGPPIMISKLEASFKAVNFPAERLHIEKFSF